MREPDPPSAVRQLEAPIPHSPESPSTEAIRVQLAKILASSGFARAERKSRFLRFTVESVLAGRGDQIKEYLLGIEVFDREASYNPQIDPIVRVEAGRVRSKLKEYYEKEGQKDPVVIEYPKGSYVPVFEVQDAASREEPLTEISQEGEASAGAKTWGVRQSKLKEESDPGTLEATGSSPGVAVRGKLWWAGVLVAVAVSATAVGIAVRLWLNRSDRTLEQTQLTAVPLTTYRGHEMFPSLSPDGTQVAFVWCREGEPCHIFIKQIGVEPPVPLTEGGYPAWSPDGRFIAFVRWMEPKKLAVILIPQRGGNERQLASWDLSKITGSFSPPWVAWTPDSQWVAFPSSEWNEKRLRLLLMSVNSGEKRWLTTAPIESGDDSAPAFSPDGGTLAFIRHRENDADLYILRLREGYWPQAEPERVPAGFPFNGGPVWMPDGGELLIESGMGIDSMLWRITVSNPAKPIRLNVASENAGEASFSKTGKRLAFSVYKYDSNIWRVDLGRPGGTPGSPVELISSTRMEGGPEYSADGKRIAYVSSQTGRPEIWICDSEGRNPVQLTSFGLREISGGLRWSPDNQSIALSLVVEGSQDVYVVSVGGGAPRRLTTQHGINHWPFWSHDGSWIYFKNSPSPGPSNIWKVPVQGGASTQVTHLKGGVDVPQESPDGKYIYFARGWPFTLSVWRVPIEGGEERKVLDSVEADSKWTVRQKGIYYLASRDANGAGDLCFFDFGTGKVRKLLRASQKMGGFAISPDGQTVLYTQTDYDGSDLMLVENFR